MTFPSSHQGPQGKAVKETKAVGNTPDLQASQVRAPKRPAGSLSKRGQSEPTSSLRFARHKVNPRFGKRHQPDTHVAKMFEHIKGAGRYQKLPRQHSLGGSLSVPDKLLARCVPESSADCARRLERAQQGVRPFRRHPVLVL